MRDITNWQVYAQGSQPPMYFGGRGYTGHEHLNGFGLINMNARLYDPMLARFLAPDPFVGSGMTNDFNRYIYCGNNPLMYTDPSGEYYVENPWGGYSYGYNIFNGSNSYMMDYNGNPGYSNGWGGNNYNWGGNNWGGSDYSGFNYNCSGYSGGELSWLPSFLYNLFSIPQSNGTPPGFHTVKSWECSGDPTSHANTKAIPVRPPAGVGSPRVSSGGSRFWQQVKLFCSEIFESSSTEVSQPGGIVQSYDGGTIGNHSWGRALHPDGNIENMSLFGGAWSAGGNTSNPYLLGFNLLQKADYIYRNVFDLGGNNNILQSNSNEYNMTNPMNTQIESQSRIGFCYELISGYDTTFSSISTKTTEIRETINIDTFNIHKRSIMIKNKKRLLKNSIHCYRLDLW
jgi:RHS repeat-associated protein